VDLSEVDTMIKGLMQPISLHSRLIPSAIMEKWKDTPQLKKKKRNEKFKFDVFLTFVWYGTLSRGLL
jgi:hypothetical protein